MDHVIKLTDETGNNIYKFPTLYKIDSKKKERAWMVTVVDSEIPEIRILHGITDGNLVDKVTPIKKGKGKNTALEQALSESQSKYNAKINREGYQVDKPVSSEESFIPRPMLAKTFTFESLSKKTGKIVFPAYAQAKLDGIRCFARTNTGELKSRQMKPFETLDHIAEEVKLLGSLMGNDKLWLDGEIYNHDMEFGVIQGICNSITSSKKLTPEKLAQAKELKYFIYDMYDHNEPNMGYEIRFKKLLMNFEKNKVNPFKHLVLLETFMVDIPDTIPILHQKFVSENYEGIILRNRDGPYEANKRSQHLQKYKHFLDEEFPIISFKPADNDYWVDSQKKMHPVVTWICRAKNGNEFSVKHKAPKKVQHQYLLDGKKYVGCLLTVIFQEYTPDGVPRFPVGKEIRNFVDIEK